MKLNTHFFTIFRRWREGLLSFIIIIALAMPLEPAWPARGRPGEDRRAFEKTIVIDPGHGGHDTGAVGTDGLKEKNIALMLARLLKAQLDGAFRVILTRTDDYWVDLDMRTATANYEKAALFLSLHAGSSRRQQTGGMTFCYYRPSETPSYSGKKPAATDTAVMTWGVQQWPHIAASRFLAERFQKHFSLLSDFPVSSVNGMPLRLFEGAGMPAVLIEMGYLSNPAEAAQIRDPAHSKKLAENISHVIVAYFEANP